MPNYGSQLVNIPLRDMHTLHNARALSHTTPHHIGAQATLSRSANIVRTDRRCGRSPDISRVISICFLLAAAERLRTGLFDRVCLLRGGGEGRRGKGLEGCRALANGVTSTPPPPSPPPPHHHHHPVKLTQLLGASAAGAQPGRLRRMRQAAVHGANRSVRTPPL